jgi:hopene-associated glycosyltransferase HpnB
MQYRRVLRSCSMKKVRCGASFGASYTDTVRGTIATVGLAALGAWTYLLAFRGRFWSVRENHVRPRISRRSLKTAVAVVPARNEADVIGRSVTSLLKQQELSRVVLVDDDSSDATAQVAREAAAQLGDMDRLIIVSGAKLPQGWSGKLWAMQQGLSAALAFQPDFVLFTDADIVHAPNSTATLVALAEERGCHLVSFMAKLHCRTSAEKWLIPAFVFFFFKLYPPRWISSERRATAGAAGGCMLVRPEALARAGGLQAIRGEIIDDCALASAVKRSGGSVLLSLTDLVSSERPYSTNEIGRMISRTAFSQLRHSSWLLAGSLVGLTLLYVAPPTLLLSGIFRSATPGERTVTAIGGIAWLMMSAAYLPMVRFYRLNPLWAVTLPSAALFYMGAAVHSALTFWTGRGGRWKGRIQDPAIARQL